MFADAFLALLSVLNTVISSRTVGISVSCCSMYWVFIFSVKSYPWPPNYFFFLKNNLPIMLFLHQSNSGSTDQLPEVFFHFSCQPSVGKRKEIRIWDLKRCRWKVGRGMWWSNADSKTCPFCPSFLTAFWPLWFWFHALLPLDLALPPCDILGAVFPSVHPSFFD